MQNYRMFLFSETNWDSCLEKVMNSGFLGEMPFGWDKYQLLISLF
jgi:hypothetical protein